MDSQPFVGLSTRSLWLGWLITLVIPVIVFSLFLPSYIDRQEGLLQHALQKQLLSEMRALQRQLFLFDFSSRQVDDILAQLHQALATGSIQYPGLSRRLIVNEEREILPGFAYSPSGLTYRDFLPAEFYHLVVKTLTPPQMLSTIAPETPALRLETEIPSQRLVHPSRSWIQAINFVLAIILVLSALGILLRHRITFAAVSLRTKVGLLITLGLVVPVTGFWLATLSRYEMQNLLQKMELATHLEQQLESLEYRIAGLEDQKALELLKKVDSVRERLCNPQTVFETLEALVKSWPIGVLCLIRQDNTWAEVDPKIGRYTQSEHRRLRDGIRRMIITAIHPALAAPDSGSLVENKVSPEEVMIQTLLETLLSADRLTILYRNPGVLFEGFETMSFNRTMILPLASWSMALEMTAKGDFFWIPFLNQLVKGIPGESLSGLTEESDFARIEYGVFLKPYRHALSFQKQWFPLQSEFREPIGQAAHQNLFEGSASLSDAWNENTPFLMFVRPFTNLPFIGVARAIPAGRDSPLQRLAGAFTGFYALGLLIFLAGALARLVSGPIALFVEGVERVRAGNYRTRVEVRSGDEIEAIGDTFNLMVIGLDQKRKLSRFVSENVIEAVKEADAEVRGRREEVTILFSHVRHFSRMLAERPPEEIFHFLNLYFTQVGFVIRKQGGTIDKFIGDAIMAVFQDRGEAPVTEPAPVRAARAALLMKEQIANLNAFRQQRGQPSVEIGIGLHRGEVIAGRIGSQNGRLDFTVIGDTVNLAARLESESPRATTTGILISAAIAEALPSDLGRTALGEISVKGRTEPVTVFELTATPRSKV